MLLEHLQRVVWFSIAGLIIPMVWWLRCHDRAMGFALMNLSWLVANLVVVWWIIDHQRRHIMVSGSHLDHVREMMLANLALDLLYLAIGWWLWQSRKGKRPALREGLALGVIWQALGLMFLDGWFLVSIHNS
jgi:hypothetical protein